MAASAQVKIIDKKYLRNSISYKLKLNTNYHIVKKDNSEKIIFPDYMNESNPNEAKLPGYDIFLAIPQNSNPKISYEVISQKIINAVPEFNPIVNTINGKIIYEESVIPKYSSKILVEEKGKLRIDNNYCLHLKINPFHLNEKSGITFVEIIKLDIMFNSGIDNQVPVSSGEINNIILDKEFASSQLIKSENIRSKNDSWIDYSAAYIKLGTAKDGIYRLYKNDIESLGILTATINPKTFKLYLKGNEIPIFVYGENDFLFDESDYIEFFGLRNMGGIHREISNYNEPYNEYLGRYTDTTIYWLTWGAELGQRVVTADKSVPAYSDTLEYYSQIEHYETNTWFDFSMSSSVRREMPDWTENKTWHEGNLGVGIRNCNFTATDIYPDKQFKMFVKLQDFASNISTNAHLITLGLNSTDQWSNSIYIDKYEQVVIENELNSSLLLNGANTLKINSIPTNASINACIFDWYEIEYPRYLKAENDSLAFQFPFLTQSKGMNVKITNLSDTQLVLWKKGNVYKKYFTESEQGTIVFGDTLNANDKIILADENLIGTPKIYYTKIFNNLRNSENQADYIAVTHKNFLSKVNEYAGFVGNSYNLSTAVVDIDDIYDEYSFGFFNPIAVKDFLISTHDYWRDPKPEYVVLIGGATYDYYGNKYKNLSSVKDRVINYVPSFGVPVSDNWFVVWDTTGAYIPQMNIGRLPVTSNEQLDRYFEKHRDYISQDFDDWNKKYLFFSSGDAASPSEINLLRESNQFVIDNYLAVKPVGGQYEHFYKTVNPPSNFGPYSKDYFQKAVDNGAVFISYLGHSGTQIWDNSITSPAQLKNNRNRYPIISDFGCSTAKFAESDITSFSELFVLAEEGQAIAYIGNSSLGFVSSSVLSPKLFYKKILGDNIFNISEAHKEAKLEMISQFGSSDVYKVFALTNTLIGDPVITLPIPQKPNFVLNKGLSVSTQTLTDLSDSVKLSIGIRNLGYVPDDSLDLLITHSYKNISETYSLQIVIPNFEDSININLPVKDKAGRHLVTVQLDSKSKYDEISEDDNYEQIEFNVASSSIRPFVQYKYANGIFNRLRLLNSTTVPNAEIIEIEISDDDKFLNKEIYEIPFDTVFTTIELNNTLTGKRYWGRTRIKGSNDYSPSFSFVKEKNKFFMNDSLSNLGTSSSNLTFGNNQWSIDSTFVLFELFSAGFEDGQAAIISRNGINYVPTPTVGHHISLFNADPPYSFIEYKYFNTFAGGDNITAYINFLDTLSGNRLVAIAVSDEGSLSNVELINLIKSLGSKFIDEVGFRSSWAFIGRKGALTGTMPEAVSKAGDGPVSINTTFSFLADSGSFITQELGYAGRWKELVAGQELPSNSNISFFPIGIKSDGSADTLKELLIINSSADLSEIDPKIYPKLKILALFNSNENNESPVLNSFGVDYDMPPELAVNYQVVLLLSDSVNAGENAELKFDVYNAGESPADSFYIKVYLVNENNKSSFNVLEQFVASIDSFSKKSFNISYNTTNLSGHYKFDINADAGNKIIELYKDNNFYLIPFYVKPDTNKPSLILTIDGNDIFDGEYIRPNPLIKIELNDNSVLPITDTSSVKLFLDNTPVYYSGNNNISYSISNSNPKYTVEFKPELNDGEHTIEVFAEDASGNLAEQNGLSKSFIVSTQVKLLNLFNYPNPFSNDTYFTFTLTQIPDEFRIKIYTIAGRLVKEIRKNRIELNNDFNKIYWDGRDEDGDLLGSGVYIYKAVIEANGISQDITQKLAIVR